MIITAFGYDAGGGDLSVRMGMQHGCNPAAKSKDHKRPDQRKINHIGDDGIKTSDKKHSSYVGMPKLV